LRIGRWGATKLQVIGHGRALVFCKLPKRKEAWTTLQAGQSEYPETTGLHVSRPVIVIRHSATAAGSWWCKASLENGLPVWSFG